jgi:hypothetical protein
VTNIRIGDLQLGDCVILKNETWTVADIQSDYCGNYDVKLLNSSGIPTFTVFNDLVTITA